MKCSAMAHWAIDRAVRGMGVSRTGSDVLELAVKSFMGVLVEKAGRGTGVRKRRGQRGEGRGASGSEGSALRGGKVTSIGYQPLDFSRP